MPETFKTEISPFEFTPNEFFYRGNLVNIGSLSPIEVKGLMYTPRRILLSEGVCGFGGVSEGKNGNTDLVVWTFDSLLRQFQIISSDCQTIDEAKTILYDATRFFGD